MSATRRIFAAGLPSVAVAAALAFSASPALAIADLAARPAVTATPCAEDDRTKCDYNTPAGEAPATGGPTRGHAGYGSTSPTATPTPSATTPSGNVDTVPPTTPPGVQDTGTPTPTTSTGGGVSAGELPVTGAPMGAIVSLGALLVAGGVASVFYTRRRRSA
ncbi:LPXTG-motif cell wall-anchored protein [Actinoplanes tereljensis]|uniref:Gram-positive cocci surface proteins LPxTG domain-containing protein n=1 Tax=Paractinoplanes tereljensis TaxID=571912 RepID=A0A919NH40_9ACTN|nr:LPXTG cell wall anchor domain-containing protein [Actinoplanes tereljensis]GIF18338.1 hypothetical protein Ate02nite_10680 [Actinoplanes tereljensis]